MSKSIIEKLGLLKVIESWNGKTHEVIRDLEKQRNDLLEDWIKIARRIEKYNHSGATKNQLLDLIYLEAVKNATEASGKSWQEIKELLND